MLNVMPNVELSLNL